MWAPPGTSPPLFSKGRNWKLKYYLTIVGIIPIELSG
jgi:hypothetical protein